MSVLFFDTETSDCYQKGHPEIQPRVASLAAIAFSDDGQHEVASYYSLIRPDGWKMNPKAARVNGLTDEFLMENGSDGKEVMLQFLNLFNQSRLAVAFNAKFDNEVISYELKTRLNGALEPNAFDISKTRCAMMASSLMMKMPNKFGYPGYAWPKLEEAYWFMFKQQMDGAHNALADVRATAYLTFAMRDLGYWDITKDKVVA
jgi:DNA polymerase III subunit epsilon